MQTALLLIDIQKDYFPGGKAELYQPVQAAQNAQDVLNFFRREKMPIIHIQHVNTRENATFFLKGTEGVEFYDGVLPMPEETVVVKHTPNSFYQTELQDILQRENIGSLVVCGMMSHMCIDTTVRSAKDRGYNVTLLEDACTTMDLYWQNQVLKAPAVHQTFMAALSYFFARVCTAQEFLK